MTANSRATKKELSSFGNSAVSRTGPALLLVWTFLHVNVAAQEFAITGYVLELPAVQALPSETARALSVDAVAFFNAARLRIRPSLVLWEGATLSGEYELSSAFMRNMQASAITADLGHRQAIPMRWLVSAGRHWRIEHFIDRLAFRQNLDAGAIIIGRQRISWGSGRIWNPTDLFNPVNPANYAKIEKDGVDALSARLNMGNFTDLQAVVNSTRSFRSVNGGLRFRTNYSGYDFSLMTGRFDGAFVVGGDVAGNLLDAGVRAEGRLEADGSDGGGARGFFIAGIDRQFTPELYALLECHYNGAGASAPDAYDLEALAAGRILNLGRSYAAVMTSWLPHPLVTASASVMTSFTDGSVLLHLLLTLSATDDLQISMGGMISAGDPGDEYPYYPRAAYARVEWHF